MEKKKMGFGKMIFISILIIILILILLLVAYTLRNYSIVKDLQNKIAPYKTSSNYHAEFFSTSADGTETKINYYQKENKKAYFIERLESGEIIAKLSYYNNGERIDFFTETSGEKLAKLGETFMPQVDIVNGLEMDDNMQMLVNCIISKIKKVEYQGRECYEIKAFHSPDVLYEDGEFAIIIDKETGLNVKEYMGDSIFERTYEFDNVDDSIFIEPNIGEYKLQLNN